MKEACPNQISQFKAPKFVQYNKTYKMVVVELTTTILVVIILSRA
nr:MAG TPA: hypothetical protein [Caudoviricetes sp.]